MLKLLFGLALLAALGVAIALVPVHGRTLLERWNAAHGAGDFVERSVHEAKVALGLEQERPRPQRASRPAKPTARAAHPATPTEHHTDADRAALDRIVADRAGR
jgi:hypothetical protein